MVRLRQLRRGVARAVAWACVGALLLAWSHSAAAQDRAAPPREHSELDATVLAPFRAAPGASRTQARTFVVRLAYPAGTPTLFDLVAGRIPEVHVHVREREIPAALLQSDYEKDAASRVRFQRWINAIWADKDELLAQLAGTHRQDSVEPPRESVAG